MQNPLKNLTKLCLDIYLCNNICSFTEIVASPNVGTGQEVLDEPDTDVVTPVKGPEQHLEKDNKYL